MSDLCKFKNGIKEIFNCKDGYVKTHKFRVVKSVSFCKRHVPTIGVKNIINIAGGGMQVFDNLWSSIFDNPTITTSEGDLRYPLPYKENSFDFAICAEVFEHIDNLNYRDNYSLFNGSINLVSEIGRILKPGGKCFLSTPNVHSLNSLTFLLTNSHPFTFSLHFREYSRYEMEKILELAGVKLNILQTKHCFFRSTRAHRFLYDLLQNDKFPIEDRGDDFFIIFEKPSDFIYKRIDYNTAHAVYDKGHRPYDKRLYELRGPTPDAPPATASLLRRLLQNIVNRMQPLNGVVDGPWYYKQYPDVKNSGMDPADHYDKYGWREGRNPAPWFDTRHYLTMNPNIEKGDMNPLLHYLIYGLSEEGKSVTK